MPGISKRGNAYRIIVSLGYDLQGKQIRKTTTFTPPVGTTPSKAEKLATAFAYEFEAKCRGMLSLNENIRFIELADWYFQQVAPLRLKERYLQSNQYLIQTYVIPEIGQLKLKDITPLRLDNLFAKLLTEGRTRELYTLKHPERLSERRQKRLLDGNIINKRTLNSALTGGMLTRQSVEKISAALGKQPSELFQLQICGGGLEPSSIHRIRNTLSPVFSAAVRKGILTSNPVANSTPPKDETRERAFLDINQCHQLLEIADQFRNAQLTRAVKVLLLTGMRVGELMALHWDNIDFSKALIEIRHTLIRLNGTYKLSTPKTRSSERLISIPQEVIRILVEQREAQAVLRRQAGAAWEETHAVFTGKNGGYMNSAYLNNSFRRLLRKNDMPPLHIHDLRHANASLLINMGVPIKVISEHLGHLDTRTTETIYAHLYQKTKAKTSEAINKALSLKHK